jgi:cellulose synthase/poly-beta-1,6-N-acetylglucosamine synthase-like glycosyltransferase
MELVIRLHRSLCDAGRRYRIGFVPEPVCWTEAPSSLAVLRRQRVRWQRGLIDCLSRHRGMLFNPRYGAVGLLALPYALTFELLGPLVELFGFLVVPLAWALGALAPGVAGAFFAVAVVYAVLISIVAVLLDDLAFRRYRGVRQILAMASAAVVEAVALRPLVSLWRVTAFKHHLQRDLSWGAMERAGIGAAAQSAGPRGR